MKGEIKFYQVQKKTPNFFKDMNNVMAQIKQSMDDITHLNINVKRFKEMAKTSKEKKS